MIRAFGAHCQFPREVFFKLVSIGLMRRTRCDGLPVVHGALWYRIRERKSFVVAAHWPGAIVGRVAARAFKQRGPGRVKNANLCLKATSPKYSRSRTGFLRNWRIRLYELLQGESLSGGDRLASFWLYLSARPLIAPHYLRMTKPGTCLPGSMIPPGSHWLRSRGLAVTVT